MKNTGTLKVTPSGERDVLIERVLRPRAAESYDRMAALLADRHAGAK